MRIAAGKFKGRNLLPPPRGGRTRPITGLAKKSLFDMLSPALDGATVLDLYCGTGTLGLEALSRGASQCFFAERFANVIDRLRRNIAAVGAASQCTVWRGDVEKKLHTWLRQLAQPVDAAFVDPPYQTLRKWDWQRISDRLFAPLAGKLAPDGLVVLRAPTGAELPDDLAGLSKRRTKAYGDMVIKIYSLPKPARQGD